MYDNEDRPVALTDKLPLPLMEKLEKELAMLDENMAKTADAFERIYEVVPDPIMKNASGDEAHPEQPVNDRLSKAIRKVNKLNSRMFRLGLKINTTIDTVLGARQEAIG